MQAINQLHVSDVYHKNNQNQTSGQQRHLEPTLSPNPMLSKHKRNFDEMMESEALVPDFDLPGIFNESSIEFDPDLSESIRSNAFLQ